MAKQRLTDGDLAMFALKAAQKAYSPYSGIQVGAALEADGSVFSGANVENRSYGLTVCAERSAVFAAVSAGSHKFERIAIASPQISFIVPCGACLQVLAEFCDDLKIILVGRDGKLRRTSLRKLLPTRFVLKK